MKRRSFLKCALTAPLVVKSSILGAQGVPPSEQVLIGVVGIGGRSYDLIKTLFQIPTARIVSACDCFKPRINSAMKSVGEKKWLACVYTSPGNAGQGKIRRCYRRHTHTSTSMDFRPRNDSKYRCIYGKTDSLDC